MFIATASACAVTMVRLLHSCQKYLQEPPLPLPSSGKYLHRSPVKLPASPFRPSSISLNPPMSKYPFFPMAASPLIINQKSSVTITPPKAKHRSSRQVRIRCRFGGKLMQDDGALHYVGGQTYITDIDRDATLQEFYYKMEEIYGGPAVIRYKLSDQNLDTLVSVLSNEDLDNMLEEYDCLLEAPDGQYAMLEVFLFNDVKDNIEGSIRGDGEGNDNSLSSENQSFSTHSSIDEENNESPQIVNPSYDMPFPFSMSPEPQPPNQQMYREILLRMAHSNSILNNQDPRNIPGPLNNTSYFGHFRLAQGSSTNEVDENFQNIVELVESVLYSP